MRTFLSIIGAFAVAASLLGAEDQVNKPAGLTTPLSSASPSASPAEPTSSGPTYVYDQKPMGGRSYLVTPEQAQAVIGKFKETYAKAGNPRLLIFINRELVDESSGPKLSAPTENGETTRPTSTSGAANAGTNESQRAAQENSHPIRDRKELSLADRQTMRDVERLFGRPLRMAGAAIVDQRAAPQMLNGKSLDNLTTKADSEQTGREREAISKVVDVVLEVLISSRNLTISEVSGDRVVTVPDIQVTAIRLSDSKILGQATAADLLNRAGRSAGNYDVREITEATALSLMEDMTL